MGLSQGTNLILGSSSSSSSSSSINIELDSRELVRNEGCNLRHRQPLLGMCFDCAKYALDLCDPTQQKPAGERERGRDAVMSVRNLLCR